ncbi:hypothetical protein PIIN_03602 [Serendipita indica DSM 11827]|uniref:Aminodeoxychorismate lyase n=1 Tax=Serendipita indica (strain DSM 11827) TaxID=1109443 RepID=G4TEB6_SERID|nr:hypothetical protein PIIN_03602 [Serendipita indica DSM 11827]
MSGRAPHTPDFGLFTSLRYDIQLLDVKENTALSGNGEPSPFYNVIFHYERLVEALDHFGWRFIDSARGEGTYPQTFEPISTTEKFRKRLEEDVNGYFAARSDIKPNTPLRLRPVLHHTAEFIIEITPTPPVTLQNLFPSSPLPSPSTLVGDSTGGSPLFNIAMPYTVVLDTQSTTPSSYTSHKTTARPHYDAARQRVGLDGAKSNQKFEFDPENTEVLVWNHERQIMEGSRTNVYFYRPLTTEPSTVAEDRKYNEDGHEWVTPTLGTGCLVGTGRRWLLGQHMVGERDVTVEEVKDGEIVLLSNGVRGVWAGKICLV